jgi:hypothetical protein
LFKINNTSFAGGHSATTDFIKLIHSTDYNTRIMAMFLSVYLADKNHIVAAIQERAKSTQDKEELTIIYYALSKYDIIDEYNARDSFLQNFPDDIGRFNRLLNIESCILRGPPLELIGFFYELMTNEDFKRKYIDKFTKVTQFVANNAVVSDAMEEKIQLLRGE